MCSSDLINASMLSEGRDRLINQGIFQNVSYVIANGEQLPFADGSFNAVTIAFGLRNFTDKEAGLRAMFRALKPGGRLVVLEFSHPSNQAVDRAYKGFSSLWPRIGKLVTGDEDSYRYLVESIEMHPDQETLRGMMEEAGFTRVCYQNILNGIAAIHEGMKPRQEDAT